MAGGKLSTFNSTCRENILEDGQVAEKMGIPLL